MRPNPPIQFCGIHHIQIYWKRHHRGGKIEPLLVGNNYVCRACNGQPFPQALNYKRRKLGFQASRRLALDGKEDDDGGISLSLLGSGTFSEADRPGRGEAGFLTDHA